MKLSKFVLSCAVSPEKMMSCDPGPKTAINASRLPAFAASTSDLAASSGDANVFCAATEAAQKTFASPDDAARSLVDAAKAGNREALIAVFGPGSQDIIFSGDTAQDKTNFDNFITAYTTMNRWRTQTD